MGIRRGWDQARRPTSTPQTHLIPTPSYPTLTLSPPHRIHTPPYPTLPHPNLRIRRGPTSTLTHTRTQAGTHEQTQSHPSSNRYAKRHSATRDQAPTHAYTYSQHRPRPTHTHAPTHAYTARDQPHVHARAIARNDAYIYANTAPNLPSTHACTNGQTY